MLVDTLTLRPGNFVDHLRCERPASNPDSYGTERRGLPFPGGDPAERPRPQPTRAAGGAGPRVSAAAIHPCARNNSCLARSGPPVIWAAVRVDTASTAQVQCQGSRLPAGAGRTQRRPPAHRRQARPDWRTKPIGRTARGSPPPPRQRSGAYRVFTRKRAILVKRSVKSLRTRLDGAGKGDFAHSNLRSGRARRPVCQLDTIRTVSRC